MTAPRNPLSRWRERVGVRVAAPVSRALKHTLNLPLSRRAGEGIPAA